MTQKQLQSIYKQAVEYCRAKFGGKEPDKISITDLGGFEAMYEEYRFGDWETTHEYFTVDDLSSDLEEVYNQRKKEEEEKLRLIKLKQIEDKKRFDEFAKRQRHSEYLNLKKEFENED